MGSNFEVDTIGMVRLGICFVRHGEIRDQGTVAVQNIYKYIQIYQNISKYIHNIPKKIPKYIQLYTNIYKTYKIYTKYQAAARRRQPGPAPSRGPGLAFCIYLVYLVYICLYLDIFWFFFGDVTMPKEYKNIAKYI